MSGNVKEEVDGPNIDRFCRLCLKEEGGSIEIFDNSGLSLPLRIMACASIEVKENDSLPRQMCWECRVQLEKSYLFRKRCKISDNKLHKHFRLVNAGKKSKVFMKKDDEEDDDDDYELEESITFLEKILDEETQRAKLEREEFAERLKEKIRLEETERIFTEARNFINAKTMQHQQSTTSSSEKPLIKTSKSVQVAKLTKTSSTPPPDAVEATTANSNYYPELFKDIKETYSEENTDEIEPEYYVIKRLEGDDTQSTASEPDEEVIIAEFSEENDEGDGEADVHTLTLDSFDDCSQEPDSEQLEQTAETPIYVHEDEQVVESKSEEDAESVTSTFRVDVQKTRNATKSRKSTMKQYEISKAISNVKISQTGEEDIYVMEIDDEAAEGNESIKDENSSRADEIKIFKCEYCPQAFSRRALLQRHLSVHVKNKGYSCEHCEKWFACKSSLDRHTRVHTGEKPFECEVCEKRFIQKEILKRHMIIHTGIRPHKCPHCDKSFAQKQLLRQHINLKHTENPVINMHKCFLCPKVFFHASGLSRHLLIHYGVSFKCDLCNKKFNDKSAVKRHSMTVHSGVKTAEDS